MNASVAASTEDTYRRAWKLYGDFSSSYLNCEVSLPIPVHSVALFVAYLHEKKMSIKTILTYLSGISYLHKLSDQPSPTESFLIKSLVRGAQRLAPSYDIRLPITVPVLNQLGRALQFTCLTAYHHRMFVSMFLFAFSAFARCSEITKTKPSSDKHILQFSDVSIQYKLQMPHAVQVTFRSYKHNAGKPHYLEFSHGHTSTSPVQALHDYLQVRKSNDGPLFVLPSGSPVSRNMFDKQLQSTLKFCGLDSSRYKSHSFRIGKATDCAQRGYSDAKIRLLGRWNSNAFCKYIRNSDH